MSASIISRTISSIVDQKIVLANDQCSRLMSIGSSWTTLRIGVRIRINGTANMGAIPFRIGVCSGTTNMVGSQTTTNYIGMSAGGSSLANFTWNVTYTSYDGVNIFYFCKRVNTTTTYSSGLTLGGYNGALTANQNQRTALLVQIQKGSPNYTLSGVAPPQSANTYGSDTSLSTFVAAMEGATLSASRAILGANYSETSTTTLACDEVAGGFDAVNIQWGSAAYPLEISDIVYSRIN